MSRDEGTVTGRRMACPKCEREVYVQPFCPFCDAILVAMFIPGGGEHPIPFVPKGKP